MHQFVWLDNKIGGPNGVFRGRVGLFGLNLHFYFSLLVAGKEKQHLNGKEQKNKEKGEEKSDTPEALPRPSAQDSTRTWRKRGRRTLQSSWHNTPVRLHLILMQLIHHFLKYDDWHPTIWDLLLPQIKYILHDFSQVLRLQESRRLGTLAKHIIKKYLYILFS